MVECTNINFEIDKNIFFVKRNNTLFSGVIKAVHTNYIGINIDTTQANYHGFNMKDTIEFLYSDDSCAYKCSAAVIGTKADNNSHILLISTPEIIKIIERRRHKRVSAVLEVNYAEIPPENYYKYNKDIPSQLLRNMKKTFSCNISIGGISIIAYEKVENIKQVLIKLSIGGEILTIICSLVRVEKVDNSSNYRLALEFLNLSDHQRVILSKYIDSKAQDLDINYSII